ncbi:hypothetical protein [Microbacterium sp. CJ88]|uniref:hypothetical protein n=1 Tax=Microbacterium sp. CJ88 TaxID=3445672 RepID=UPI003F65FFFF
MTATELEELRVLRERAYGPDADIHDDADALQRLRQLEESARPSVEATPSAPEPATTPDEAADTSSTEDATGVPEVAGEEDEASAPPVPARRLARAIAFARSTRGGRILAGAAILVVVLVVAATALTVVQRVQTAPLAPNAEQVVRLGVDANFAAPKFLDGARPDGGQLLGYREYGGLRAVLIPHGGFWYGPGTGVCVVVMQAADVAASTDNSFPGSIWGGCAAGAFPATAQFVVTADASEEVRSMFPIGTALQFIYDNNTGEVVLFRLPPPGDGTAAGTPAP